MLVVGKLLVMGEVLVLTLGFLARGGARRLVRRLRRRRARRRELRRETAREREAAHAECGEGRLVRVRTRVRLRVRLSD